MLRRAARLRSLTECVFMGIVRGSETRAIDYSLTSSCNITSVCFMSYLELKMSILKRKLHFVVQSELFQIWYA